jgi:hypothetical protein
MTTRYVHPAAEQQRIAMEKVEKFRADGFTSAAAQLEGHYKIHYSNARTRPPETVLAPIEGLKSTDATVAYRFKTMCLPLRCVCAKSGGRQ